MKNARRNYYIKKDFQRSFMLKYVFLVFLGVIVVNGMLYAYLDKGIDDAFYKAHVTIATTGDVVRSPLFSTTLIIVSFAIISAIIFTRLNTWKVGGRLQCVIEGLKSLKNGDLTARVKECKEDPLMELADTFNKAVRHLNKKISYIKADIGDVERASAALETDRVGTIETLLKKVDSMETNLSVFRLR